MAHNIFFLRSSSWLLSTLFFTGHYLSFFVSTQLIGVLISLKHNLAPWYFVVNRFVVFYLWERGRRLATNEYRSTSPIKPRFVFLENVFHARWLIHAELGLNCIKRGITFSYESHASFIAACTNVLICGNAHSPPSAQNVLKAFTILKTFSVLLKPRFLVKIQIKKVYSVMAIYL